jgi:hypothetical protein
LLYRLRAFARRQFDAKYGMRQASQ